MKYLLSILCLFVLGCDTGDNSIDLEPCDAILGEWKSVTAFHDFDGDCDIYDETEENSFSSECPFSVVFQNNTFIENGCNYTDNGYYECNQESIEICDSENECFNGMISVENQIITIIIESRYDDDTDCLYQTVLTYEKQ